MSTATKSAKPVWERESLHPLEYRARINGAVCILRPKDGRWTAIIDRDQPPMSVTTHDTYWHARAHCEANA